MQANIKASDNELMRLVHDLNNNGFEIELKAGKFYLVLSEQEQASILKALINTETTSERHDMLNAIYHELIDKF